MPIISIAFQCPELQSQNPIFKPLAISIDISSTHLEKQSHVLRVIPALQVSDDEADLNCDNFLLIDGATQVVNDHFPWTHSIAVIALVPCRMKLVVHVDIRMNKSSLSANNLQRTISHSHHLIMDFS